MSAHALEVLELGPVLAVVGGYAASPLGRAALEARLPSSNPDAVRRELGRVSETQRFVSDHPGWGMPAVPDAGGALERLSVPGAVLEPLELVAIGALLASGRELARGFAATRGRYSALSATPDRLHQDRSAEAAIERSVDDEGRVLDGASRQLKDIRGELRKAHARIVGELEAYMRSLPARISVPDASVTVREGRYVIPVRRGGKGDVGGVVQDESATGATVFVEPPLAMARMNELRDLERAEQREIRRVLGVLSARLASDREALARSHAALVDFDSLQARARVALAWHADAPEMLDPGSGELVIERGRHPLLLAHADTEAARDVVPFDLALAPGERALVVSGPNTGGKSVLLKAIGLIAALAQAGVVPPVRKGTRLPLFREIFADIGDEQSIAGSLSTFSAHLENVKEILARADGASLVLIDEMGTGTDPAEGAALARAVLEALVARGALCITTSHLGALKSLDTEGSGVVNASLQFDPARLEPTYRLLKGRPGRSYGLAIARRLGLPAAVLARAEDHLSGEGASVEELLEALERQEKEATALVASLDRERAEAERLRSELQAREAELRRQELIAGRRAREEARRLLMEARGEVEEAIRELRAATDAEALEEAGRRARARVEQAARLQRDLKAEAPEVPTAPELTPGRRVQLPGGTTGVVVELKDRRALVEVRALRMEVPAESLEPLQAGASAVRSSPGERSRRNTAVASGPASATARAAVPETRQGAEVDLRGLRVEQVDFELARALDGAVLAELSELRIVHGKGTGAVRKRVRELLRTDRRVREFRLGLHGEGGSGVTVARVAEDA